MTVTYDQQADSLLIRFREDPVADSDEQPQGFILDYDSEGHLVSIEIRDASNRIPDPRSVQFQVIAG